MKNIKKLKSLYTKEQRKELTGLADTIVVIGERLNEVIERVNYLSKNEDTTCPRCGSDSIMHVQNH